MPQDQPQSQSIDVTVKNWRMEIKATAQAVKALHEHPFFRSQPLTVPTSTVDLADRYEMRENIILAYRHLEDAAMRLGKVIQAYDGGKSVYDS